MSEPTYWALWYGGAGCLSNVGVYLPGTVFTVVKAVLAMLESTCRALCCRGAGCLSNVRTYLPGTVLQWWKMFQQCRSLPAGHCVTVVQTIKAVWEPTCRALCYSGADCLSRVGTYLRGTVLQWCRLFKRCLNLPTGHCVTVVQAV